jgi:DNA polymerase-1
MEYSAKYRSGLMNNLPKDGLLLVDLSCWVWRYTAASGRYAPRSVRRLVERCAERSGARYVGICGDHPGPCFRAELYPEYKANREERPALVAQNMQITRDYLEDIHGAITIEAAGFEADDVIATLTERAVYRGIPVIILGVDKDMMQLVRDEPPVIMWDGNSKITTSATVSAKIGVPPEKASDFQALVGDRVDNIPGVYGIGPRRAFGLITTQFLKGAYKHMDGFELSKKLVTLRRDVPLDVDLEDLRWDP